MKITCDLNLSPPANESEFVSILSCALLQNGYNVWTEIPNMGQSADLVAQKDQKITVVEAKLKGWRRALAQCLAHEMVADYVCVALCSAGIPVQLQEEATNRGYGLLHYSLKTKMLQWVVQPRENPNIWLPQRNRFISFMRSIGNVC